MLLKTARSLCGSLYSTYVMEEHLNRSRCSLVLGYWLCLAQGFARRKCWEVFKSNTIIYEEIDCSWQFPHIASWLSTQGSWENIICSISAPLPWNIWQGEKPSYGLLPRQQNQNWGENLKFWTATLKSSSGISYFKGFFFLSKLDFKPWGHRCI